MFRLGSTLRIAFSPSGDYDAPNIRAITINNQNICSQVPTQLSAPSVTTPRPIRKQVTTIRPIATTTIISSTTVQITEKQCTVPARDATLRVSNGERVPDRYYPWHVSIFKSEGISSMFICGGSIISNEYILTAAHCLHEENLPIVNSRLFIRAGSNFRESGVHYRINAKVIHSDYHFSNYKSDIALLQTRNEIIYSRIIRPVCYTGFDFEYTNIDAWVYNLNIIVLINYLLKKCILFLDTWMGINRKSNSWFV